ncbi:unnamed protein product, partial [Rotaria sp. Silwood2]
ASEQQITSKNARRIKAKIVAEGANGSIPSELTIAPSHSSTPIHFAPYRDK